MSAKRYCKVKAVDLEKFKALVLYICDAFSTNPTSLGKVKLQKILWNLDRTAYLKSGSTISGVPYVKMPQGPATPLLDDAISELERDGKLTARFESAATLL